MGWVSPIKDKETVKKFSNALREYDVKYYIMFEIGIGTGLMLQDILNLKVKDVYKKKSLDVVIGARKIKRTFNMPQELQDVINNYVEGKNPESYLLIGRINSTAPLTREQAYRVFKQIGTNVGLTNLGAQTMRKTFAWNYYKETGDIEYIQTLLNHASSSITYRYIGERPNVQILLRKSSAEENQRSRYLLYLDDSGKKRINAVIDELNALKDSFDDPTNTDAFFGCVDSFLNELDILIANFKESNEKLEEEYKIK